MPTVGGGLAPGPWTTKPSLGSVEFVPFGVCWAVVNHCTPDVRPESPVDVEVMRVSDPEPSRPTSPIDTVCAVDPVLVTMFSQRRNSPLLGTKTLRVTCRFRTGKLCVWKTS